MNRPLILAAIVALAIGLIALGAGAVRDAAPSTHAQGSATPTPGASPTASPSPSPSPSPTTTIASSTPTCTAATLGGTGVRAANPKLAADCDTLLGLRYTLSRPDTLNWGDTTETLATWDGVTVSGTPKRVTGLELAPYAFRGALEELAKLDALDTLALAVHTTPTTSTTPTTPTTTVTPATTATTLPTGLRCTTTTLGGSPTAAANRTLALDCSTLLAMKSILAGTATLNWSQALALTSWDGVEVSGTPKRVSKLALNGKSLTGKIPTQLGALRGLTVLNLSQNQLTGAIPTQIGDLAALENLDLGYNQLTGSIPTQVGKLRRLTTLTLQWNMLTGKIPTQLENLESLTMLNLRRNRLGGDFTTDAGYGIPTQLGNLTALIHLLLSHNDLGGPIPTQLGNLVKLGNLRLQGNSLSGPLPTQLGNLVNLWLLNLYGNQLSGSIPPQLGNIGANRTGGTGFVWSGNSFTGCAPGRVLDIAVDIPLWTPLNLPACPTTTN